jgi:CubicO group peptidase (beta-lactamase class C family)
VHRDNDVTGGAGLTVVTLSLLRPRLVTIRHLLTHTAGIGYWRRLSDLFHPGVGSGDLGGQSVQPLAEYYRPAGIRKRVTRTLVSGR